MGVTIVLSPPKAMGITLVFVCQEWVYGITTVFFLMFFLKWVRHGLTMVC